MNGVPVLAVHGIGNLQKDLDPGSAARVLAEEWRKSLAEGYAACRLTHLTVPDLVVAYYAHHLSPDESQDHSDTAELEQLTAGERRIAWDFLHAAGAPVPAEEQGWPLAPLRQALHWVATVHRRPAELLSRVVVALAREVYTYLSSPARRRQARTVVIDAVRTHRPRVVLAHSLGSVVAYEALHEATDLRVDLLITLGSPLGLRGAVFDALDPEPRAGRGSRPPGVNRWYNVADPGDLVALPKKLGGRFPVDRHETTHIGLVDFHTLGGYLSEGTAVAGLAAYVS
ncbi:serine peptidase [Streptomyces sp. NPDC058469]|uniref:serine peptidase n=1 Tax=Streptomyces sp. NPDC058469 TaxID=3346514 RepID=UPI00365F4527